MVDVLKRDFIAHILYETLIDVFTRTGRADLSQLAFCINIIFPDLIDAYRSFFIRLSLKQILQLIQAEALPFQ